MKHGFSRTIRSHPAGLAEAGCGKTRLFAGGATGFAGSVPDLPLRAENNEIRFETDASAIETAGLRVSSRLVRVAELVWKGC